MSMFAFPEGAQGFSSGLLFLSRNRHFSAPCFAVQISFVHPIRYMSIHPIRPARRSLLARSRPLAVAATPEWQYKKNSPHHHIVSAHPDKGIEQQEGSIPKRGIHHGSWNELKHVHH